MNIPANLKYTKTDEWYDPATGALGLTDYAQSQLSDLVFVEIHVEPGESLEPGKAIASVELVKASAETYSPVGGQGLRGQQGHFRETRDDQQRSIRRRLDDQGRRRRPGRGPDGRRGLREILRRAHALIARRRSAAIAAVLR